MMEGPEEVTLILDRTSACLACSFNLRALMRAIHAGVFPLCRIHLDQAAAFDPDDDVDVRSRARPRSLRALPPRG